LYAAPQAEVSNRRLQRGRWLEEEPRAGAAQTLDAGNQQQPGGRETFSLTKVPISGTNVSEFPEIGRMPEPTA